MGLIGGSMAIDLKRKGFAKEIYGVEAEPVNAAAAEKIGLVDRMLPFEDCVDGSDIVVLAVPVGAAVKLLPKVLDRFAQTGAKGKIVMDGTPREIFSQVGELKKYRLDVPQVTELADELQKAGMKLKKNMLLKTKMVS